MEEEGAFSGAVTRPSLLRRLVVWSLIVGITWIPGLGTLAMLLTGNAGR
jgi:hypothetical protein